MGGKNYKKTDGTDGRSKRGRRGSAYGDRQLCINNPFPSTPVRQRFLKGRHVKQEQILGIGRHFGQHFSELLGRNIDVLVFEEEYKNLIGGMHLYLEYELPQLQSFGVYIHYEALTGNVIYVGKTGIPFAHRILQGLGPSKSRLLTLGDYSESRWVKKKDDGVCEGCEVIENNAFDTTLLAINIDGVAHSTKKSVALASVLEVCVLKCIHIVMCSLKSAKHSLPVLNKVMPKLSSILTQSGIIELLREHSITSEDFSFCVESVVAKALQDIEITSSAFN